MNGKRLVPFFALEGHTLISMVYAHKVNEYIDKSLLQVDSKSKLGSVNDDSNPVIVRYNLK